MLVTGKRYYAHEHDPGANGLLLRVTKQIIFSTPDLGDLELPLEMIRKITIDRSRNPPVEVSTSSKTYGGDFRKYHPTIVAKNLLVVTKPFVSVKDFRNEIDLESVEHAVLEATSAPIAAQVGG